MEQPSSAGSVSQSTQFRCPTYQQFGSPWSWIVHHCSVSKCDGPEVCAIKQRTSTCCGPLRKARLVQRDATRSDGLRKSHPFGDAVRLGGQRSVAIALHHSGNREAPIGELEPLGGQRSVAIAPHHSGTTVAICDTCLQLVKDIKTIWFDESVLALRQRGKATGKPLPPLRERRKLAAVRLTSYLNPALSLSLSLSLSLIHTYCILTH